MLKYPNLKLSCARREFYMQKYYYADKNPLIVNNSYIQWKAEVKLNKLI